jgi:predicted transcriptional regulator
MAKSMISARIEARLKEDVDAIAVADKRPSAFVVSEALEEYVRRRRWLNERIASAVKEANETTAWISNEAMVKWMNSLGTDSPLPPPEPDVIRPSRKPI